MDSGLATLSRPGMTTWLHLPPRQILHRHPIAFLDHLRDHLAVAMGAVALVAEQADGAGLLYQRGELVHLFFGLRRLQVLRVDLFQHIVLPAARGETSFL